jgi:uncharacterized protein YgiM (DUF1202 family)
MKLRKFMISGLLSLLWLLLASSWVQAYSGYYYVIPSSIQLRECAGNNCLPLLTVYKGEKVEILEKTSTGWCRVRLVDRPVMGWIPSSMLTYRPGTPSEPGLTYYVNIDSLTLRNGPRPEDRAVTTLHLNDAVEMIGVSSGRAQVRDLKTSLVGWAPPRYLSLKPKGYRQPTRHRRRAPKPKAPPKEEKAPVPSVM